MKKSISHVELLDVERDAVRQEPRVGQLASAALEDVDERHGLPVERERARRGAAPRCACSVTSPRSSSASTPRSAASPSMRGTGTGMLANSVATFTNGREPGANGDAWTAMTKGGPCRGRTRK